MFIYNILSSILHTLQEKIDTRCCKIQSNGPFLASEGAPLLPDVVRLRIRDFGSLPPEFTLSLG